MSGDPGSWCPFVLKLCPRDLRIDRTATSGDVPFCLTLDIKSERWGDVFNLLKVVAYRQRMSLKG